MDEVSKEYVVTSGVPYSPAQGPLLWNVMHNGVLALPIREEATSTVSADDQAVVVTSRYSGEVEV